MSNIESIVEQLSSLTLIQAAELSKKLEEKWGVSASAPVAVSASAATESVAVAEKTEFDVVLTGFNATSKINVIKEVRAITNLGLKEAKELVESSPKSLKGGVSKGDAEEIKKKLEAAGATIDIR
ncbi:50S ribosomal subunit protein L12 [Candidatus Liberibacter solanacearum]|uniref:Large ribosomal subunit protein bL12 n=3 Tax=Liberibacter TaxID=34019 RepID=B5ABM2_9HYPH|nr:50S ribosomal protein L7/L12 [Candidatus Liberibacter solanacearum]ACF39953.1 50S ribosomal subunit protein L12 [Candidatus Liberibacter solanacearum]ARI45998.1 50S ribosomal subunit L12 [Candidatus Liberibacter solanacearum]ARI46000.1 50S ribosomal protein L12 [Candidatus Liberibacter solanacearum]AWT40892.1 50S ribosomal subunit protein L12 [Candidatus Liberibacter solanacearum]AWT40894.1 50S ribosomal subunit protein L12 [Candidatus Liberibacter solanacearum]